MALGTGIDEGTAYGRKPGTINRELTEVGPGTPMGEFMRRYWHPIALSEKASHRAAEQSASSARI